MGTRPPAASNAFTRLIVCPMWPFVSTSAWHQHNTTQRTFSKHNYSQALTFDGKHTQKPRALACSSAESEGFMPSSDSIFRADLST